MGSSHRTSVSFAVLAAVVLLRFAIGWHFYSAGAEKLKDPDFRSAYFLDGAVGPFASFYQGLIPDALGTERLNLEQRHQAWDTMHDQCVDRFPNDAEKKKVADQIRAEHDKKFDYFVALYGEDIKLHLLEVERYENASRDPNISESFGRDWLTSKRYELRTAIRPWINDLDKLDADYRADLLKRLELDPSAIRPPQQLGAKGWVDHCVTWTLLLVGVCLLLGLLTIPSALVGMAFLLSVLATQPFWVSGANLVYLPYQLVELAGLIVIATFRAGRFAGLDYFSYFLFNGRRTSTTVAQ